MSTVYDKCVLVVYSLLSVYCLRLVCISCVFFTKCILILFCLLVYTYCLRHRWACKTKTNNQNVYLSSHFLNNTHIVHKYLSDENKWSKTKPNPLFNSWNKRDNKRKNHQLMTTSWNCNTNCQILFIRLFFENNVASNQRVFAYTVSYMCYVIYI